LKEITSDIRLTISVEAYLAQIHRKYGAITALANKYNISRQFVYNLLYILQISFVIFFSAIEEAELNKKRESVKWILALRFEGKCSIGAISTIMKRMNPLYSSEGYISQTIKEVGKFLPRSQEIEIDGKSSIEIVSDEIFSKSKPILISAEPKSTAILGITLSKDRTAVTWSEHFKKILDTNPNLEIKGATTDEGTGLCSAIETTFPFITRQPDTYHGVAHVFGLLRARFEKKVEMAIKKEKERDRVCMKRETDKVFEEKYKLYENALETTIQAVEKYEAFTYLYTCMFQELQSFDKDGEIRDREKATEEIQTALDLIEELDQNISDEVKRVRKLLPTLLNYFEQTKKSVKECRKLGIDDDLLKVFFLAWQWNKSYIKAKKPQRRDKAKWERDFYFEYAKDLIYNDFERMKESIFDELDNIIQASSAIENINSILRFYLDSSRSQTTQEFLNIFAFYHNHRRYKAGKRKGKTPMELLTGKNQEKDWLELLLDIVEKKKPDFFL